MEPERRGPTVTIAAAGAAGPAAWNSDGGMLAWGGSGGSGGSGGTYAFVGGRARPLPGAWSVAWGAHAVRLLTGGLDGAARIWDAAAGAPLLTVAHGGPVSDVCWCPDQSQFATHEYGGSTKVWCAYTGALLWQAAGSWGPPSWSPDGTVLLTLTPDAAVLRDADSFAPAQRFPARGHARWSPGGGLLVDLGDEAAGLVDLAAGATLRLKQPGLDFERSAGWSPDSAAVATLGDDVRVWDATGAILVSPRARGVHRIAWGPEGWLAGSTERETVVWRVRPGEASAAYALSGPATPGRGHPSWSRRGRLAVAYGDSIEVYN